MHREEALWLSYQLVTHGVIAPLYTIVVVASWEAWERPWFHLGAMGTRFLERGSPLKGCGSMDWPMEAVHAALYVNMYVKDPNH